MTTLATHREYVGDYYVVWYVSKGAFTNIPASLVAKWKGNPNGIGPTLWQTPKTPFCQSPEEAKNRALHIAHMENKMDHMLEILQLALNRFREICKDPIDWEMREKALQDMRDIQNVISAQWKVQKRANEFTLKAPFKIVSDKS